MATGNRSGGNTGQLILLAIIFLGISALLFYLLVFQAAVPTVTPPAVAPTVPVAPRPSLVPGPPKPVVPVVKVEPAEPAATGRCADPSLIATLQTIVNDCVHACGVNSEKDPLFTLNQAQFNDLFATGEDDAGFATHFAIFGCNIYGSQDCRGYDAMYTHPDDPAGCEGSACDGCPSDEMYEWVNRPGVHHPMSDAAGAQANCKEYAGSIARGFTAFIEKHKDADQYIFIGTASTTGNRGKTMNPKNRALAGQRAARLRDDLVKMQLAAPKEFTGRGGSYVVVLDNTVHQFSDPRFKRVLTKQVNKEGIKRTFRWDSSNAVNRSVMVLAIRCPGL